MVYLKLFFTTVFWGGTFIAGKIIAGKVNPYEAAFLRFLIASSFLILLTIKIEGRLPAISLKKTGIIMLLGLTGIFSYNLFFFSGLQYIQANQASLIIATNPIFISFCAALFFKEKISLIRGFGLCLSVSGALTVISGGDLSSLFSMGLGRGQLLIFGCVASWVAYSILGKIAMKDLSPIASVCYSSIAGTIMLFFPALFHGLFQDIGGFLPVAWISLFYLGFFGTVLGFFWYYEGINTIGPMKAGVFINFVPAHAIILAFFILNETLSLSLAVGAILIITGVYITNSRA